VEAVGYYLRLYPDDAQIREAWDRFVGRPATTEGCAHNGFLPATHSRGEGRIVYAFEHSAPPITSFGPFLAALTMPSNFRNEAGVVALLRRTVRWRKWPPVWYAVALGLPVVGAVKSDGVSQKAPVARAAILRSDKRRSRYDRADTRLRKGDAGHPVGGWSSCQRARLRHIRFRAIVIS
jgi:hypothetical protein